MRPRVRVLSDNDYSGDPDGLVQLAHHALAPSVDLRAVIGSHLAPGDPFDPSGRSAANAVSAARRVLELAGRGDVPVHAGAEEALVDARTPHRSAGAQAIVDEAMREDVDSPLQLVLGAGLTELASAYLVEPRIADRLTAVWIGGPEHPGLAEPPPGAQDPEYNLRIDVTAAQVVFASPIPLWQVPRDAYRQVLTSSAEIDLHLRTAGPLGVHLAEALDRVAATAQRHGIDLGETYTLGDTPLVLLTALQSAFEPSPSSSRWTELAAPVVDDEGRYAPGPGQRTIRVFTHLDTRLALGDLWARLALHAQRTAAAPRPPRVPAAPVPTAPVDAGPPRS